MKLADFDYELPKELIALWPLADRSAAQMLLLERSGEVLADHTFHDLPELLRGDELLVVNNTRVIPARLFGRRVGVHAERHGEGTRDFLSAAIEVLLTRQVGDDEWEALLRPGRKMRAGERVVFGDGELEAEVTGRGEYGLRRLRLFAKGNIMDAVQHLGHMPLPPYIDRPDEPSDRDNYQTIFARRDGAVAAPTASLHFTPEILERLRQRGVEFCEITLHVGLGTFQPIHEEEIERHRMHAEAYEISARAVNQIQQAKSAGRPILAAGTTVVRALEDAAQKPQGEGMLLASGKAEAEIFIRPGHDFRVVDQLLTNFHLPKSSLLVLVSAFAGRERILSAYRHAIERKYRFYSYGDCMLIR